MRLYFGMEEIFYSPSNFYQVLLASTHNTCLNQVQLQNGKMANRTGNPFTTSTCLPCKTLPSGIISAILFYFLEFQICEIPPLSLRSSFYKLSAEIDVSLNRLLSCFPNYLCRTLPLKKVIINSYIQGSVH